MAAGSRSWVLLSAIAVAAFQVVGSFGAADNQPERRAMDVVAVVLALVGPIFLAQRDRWPLAAVAASAAATVVYVASGYPYGPIFVSVGVALFSAVRAGHRRSTWALAAAGSIGFVAATIVDRRSPGISWLHLALVAGWVAVVLAVAELVRMRDEQAAEQARTEQEEHQRRQGERRLLLAQELHDVLAHNISLINVQASVTLHLFDERPEAARTALAEIKGASQRALDELRSALDLLRSDDAPRSPAPRLADLDRLVAGVRASGLDVRLERSEPPIAVPPAVELTAYRIVQEALTNVTRHARAHVATVRLGYLRPDGVTVEVTDDGIGASGETRTGNGIDRMRERAAALGGTVEAGPGAAGGFRVAAHLPGRAP